MEPTHQDAGEARKAAQSVEEDTTMTEPDTQPEAKSDQPGEQTTSPPDIVVTEAASTSGDVKAEDAVSSSLTASAASSAATEPTATAGAGPSSAMSSSAPVVRVFNPAEATSSASTPSDLDDAFFTPTLSDAQAHHASVVSRSKRLNEAPLLTSKHRDEEMAGRERRKADKWPETTIRIKFSDGTQVQSVFPSSSPIQPVYAFVRTCLDSSASSKPFTLWQPPRFTYPEHPPPPLPGQKPKPNHTSTNPHKRPLPTSSAVVTSANYGPVRGAPMPGLMGGTGGKETLGELGLVPQSVVMIRWADDDMNVTGYPAPLLPELRQKAEPLPTPGAHLAEQKKPEAAAGTKPGEKGDQPKEKKIPKWLQNGLLKKKK
ncbi:uncharacterized protein MKK02DRAFT_43236 [Dioszegia hungarica]|uniref:UBX domain-containing protein n=1 Tax=Dioszegia hungarica TaxID=4972 RepID=A0AA38HAF9_9TREE|nr:uncharacterized protein MKK02DRAFT_43236 [Dioszegia hungarica]KAI9637313.1 hypothetical protein MKK02DRAFT_43236 [Dioszegia hungarica]